MFSILSFPFCSEYSFRYVCKKNFYFPVRFYVPVNSYVTVRYVEYSNKKKDKKKFLLNE